MRSHEERLIENDIKTLLNLFPDTKNNFHFTGSRRPVDKRQARQQEMDGESEQLDSDEYQQRNKDSKMLDPQTDNQLRATLHEMEGRRAAGIRLQSTQTE